MSAQLAMLTPHQAQILFPKPRIGQGSFTTSVDSHTIPIQTKDVVHDTEKRIFGITGRNADALSNTVRTVYIQFPDDTPAGTVFHLAEGEFTNIRVWFTVDTALNKYAVRVITGTLSIQEISTRGIHIAGACSGRTERNPSGKSHEMVINFDLKTSYS
ncbi:hypothetical protein [Pseudomonas lactucae]|uniref:hypothetical protein n=1 Tax=Pseudomonas lactucae TaxID=2813360 RepID=UPI0005B345A6